MHIPIRSRVLLELYNLSNSLTYFIQRSYENDQLFTINYGNMFLNSMAKIISIVFYILLSQDMLTKTFSPYVFKSVK